MANFLGMSDTLPSVWGAVPNRQYLEYQDATLEITFDDIKITGPIKKAATGFLLEVLKYHNNQDTVLKWYGVGNNTTLFTSIEIDKKLNMIPRSGCKVVNGFEEFKAAYDEVKKLLVFT